MSFRRLEEMETQKWSRRAFDLGKWNIATTEEFWSATSQSWVTHTQQIPHPDNPTLHLPAHVVHVQFMAMKTIANSHTRPAL